MIQVELFEFLIASIKEVTYDDEGLMIWGLTHEGDKIHLLDIRGWSYISTLFTTEKDACAFQDYFGKFIADAINQKINNQSQ